MDEKAIELLRKNIENLSIPLDEEKLKSTNKNNKKNNNKNQSKKNDLIEKSFNEIYEIYNNDNEYKQKCEEKERIKALKPSCYEFIQINGSLNREKSFKKEKYKINECIKILEKNNHKSRQESIYEDDFSSSDSYDSELFNLIGTAPKDFRFKTRQDLKENEENLLEIMRVINLNQK